MLDKELSEPTSELELQCLSARKQGVNFDPNGFALRAIVDQLCRLNLNIERYLDTCYPKEKA